MIVFYVFYYKSETLYASSITAIKTNHLERFGAAFTKLSVILFLLTLIAFQTLNPMLCYLSQPQIVKHKPNLNINKHITQEALEVLSGLCKSCCVPVEILI